MELISALAADDWTSVPSFLADFDRTLGLEKLVGRNSDVLGETDFYGVRRPNYAIPESRDYQKLLVNTDTVIRTISYRTFTSRREVRWKEISGNNNQDGSY